MRKAIAVLLLLAGCASDPGMKSVKFLGDNKEDPNMVWVCSEVKGQFTCLDYPTFNLYLLERTESGNDGTTKL